MRVYINVSLNHNKLVAAIGELIFEVNTFSEETSMNCEDLVFVQ